MPRRERLQNESTTPLNGAIDDSQTSIIATNGNVFPSEGDFRILCEDELMLCTARSSNVLTVQRGIEGTTAASHADGLDIFMVLTADAVEQFIQDDRPYFNLRPSLRLFDASGNQIGESDMTWVNQGGATSTDSDNSLILVAPAAAGANVRAKVITPPSTPYSIIVGFSLFMKALDSGTNQPRAGIVLRESSSGELIMMAARRHSDTAQTTIVINRFDSPTVFNSAPLTENWVLPDEIIWLKIEDDGVDLIYYISPDGFTWEEVFQESRTAFMAGGPDEVGICANCSSSSTDVWGLFYSLTFE